MGLGGTLGPPESQLPGRMGLRQEADGSQHWLRPSEGNLCFEALSCCEEIDQEL